MKTILKMRNVTAGYGDRIVLKNLNLDVYDNDYLGIIGSNGSGKTTLVKTIIGLAKPLKGTVVYSARKTNGNGRDIGYLPQLSKIDHQFPITVIDVVLSGLLSRVKVFRRFVGGDRKRGCGLLDQMGILDLKDNQIGELSGGQMQRVFLCRAIISSPKLLILDEPNTFIDEAFAENLFEILKDLNERMAIIIVSHDIGAVFSNVKNVACLMNGTLHYHGGTEMSQDLLDGIYQCPVDIITHGDVPHRVLKKH